MNKSTRIPVKLIDFCETLAGVLSQKTLPEECIAAAGALIPDFISDKRLFKEILAGMMRGDAYPDLAYATMFDSEVILYRDPAGLFSLRMFLWEPGQYDPIHDHNSWGVIGLVHGQLEVIDYLRRDDGANEHYAQLTETNRRVLKPGRTAFVRGLESIHQTGNPTLQTIIQVSLYGRAMTKRNYINGFDITTGRVYPIYAPKIRKQQLARQALAVFD